MGIFPSTFDQYDRLSLLHRVIIFVLNSIERITCPHDPTNKTRAMKREQMRRHIKNKSEKKRAELLRK